MPDRQTFDLKALMRALKREPWHGRAEGDMRVEEGVIFWNDTLTIVRGFRATCHWWARGDAIPWLPVLVHLVAVRACGLHDVKNGSRFRAQVLWREDRPAGVVRLFPAEPTTRGDRG